MVKKKTENRKKTEHVRGVWGLICSLSSIDQERNNISLFNVIDNINIPADILNESGGQKLLFQIPHEIVVLWRRSIPVELCVDELVTDTRVKLIDPGNNVLNEILVPLKFPVGKRIMRNRIVMQGFAITSPGDYQYSVEIVPSGSKENIDVLEIPFHVTAN